MGVPPRCGQLVERLVAVLLTVAAPPRKRNRFGTVLARLLKVCIPVSKLYCCGKGLVLVAGEWLVHKKACSVGCSASCNYHRWLYSSVCLDYFLAMIMALQTGLSAAK